MSLLAVKSDQGDKLPEKEDFLHSLFLRSAAQFCRTTGASWLQQELCTLNSPQNQHAYFPAQRRTKQIISSSPAQAAFLPLPPRTMLLVGLNLPQVPFARPMILQPLCWGGQESSHSTQVPKSACAHGAHRCPARVLCAHLLGLLNPSTWLSVPPQPVAERRAHG